MVASQIVAAASGFALEPARSGGGNAANAGPVAAPSPPDVPSDGLYVAGGPSGPQALAAIVYELPPGSIATTVTLETAGLSPRVDGLRACALKPESLQFKPATNGAWADHPEYDCDKVAVEVTLAETKLEFPATALSTDGLVAFALVPDVGDRVSFNRPGTGSLQFKPDPGSSSGIEPTPATEGFVAPAGTGEPFASNAAEAGPLPVASGSDLVALPAPEVDPNPPAEEASAPRFEGPDLTGTSWRTRIGGALGLGLILAVLVFYSQGRGLLGARMGA